MYEKQIESHLSFITHVTIFNAIKYVSIISDLLQHNTTNGPFRKLGRLYGSCLRQVADSPSVKILLNQLGGYLPIGAVGPSSISELLSNIDQLGPSPVLDVYFDLSYGKRPHAILIVSAPSTSSPILEVCISLSFLRINIDLCFSLE